ncbi:hypothetical protein K3495_g3455 [Podosphaera aphanis]|nr:hypothetical protein K3495_g3455 [Podosphaera aphanis]
MTVSQEKISLYSVADLKNSTDDVIPVYLNSLKFKQVHTLSDVRLALGYTLIFISAVTCAWDYKLGFDSTKIYTAVAVAIYTILNGFLTFWTSYIENGLIYTGTNPEGDTIQVSSWVEKHVPIYNLKITTYKKNQPSRKQMLTLKKPFNHWFNRDGYFVALPLQQILASNIPMIGRADPSRVIDAKKKVSGDKMSQDSTDIMNEKWMALLAESSEAGVDESPCLDQLKKRKNKNKKV